MSFTKLLIKNRREYETLLTCLNHEKASDLQLYNLQEEENLPGYQIIHFQL